MPEVREGLPTLHDATLVSIALDWASSVAVFCFVTHTQQVTLRVEDCGGMTLPRAAPWGGSASVMGLREVAGGVEVQMQSGDVLQAVGRATLHRKDRGHGGAKDV